MAFAPYRTRKRLCWVPAGTIGVASDKMRLLRVVQGVTGAHGKPQPGMTGRSPRIALATDNLIDSFVMGCRG